MQIVLHSYAATTIYLVIAHARRLRARALLLRQGCATHQKWLLSESRCERNVCLYLRYSLVF